MKVFLLILQFLPYVMQAVQAVEVSMAGASSADKKAAVMTAVQTAAKVGETVPVGVVATLSQLVDDIVSAFNKSGVFAKKAA